ncbi:MAG: NAD(P)(+) transhydrogenase (Re/Si-specific) subunit beta [Planctomycetaceae bacterium]
MQNAINLAYLAASVLFILGLIKLSHPRTAVFGNQLGAIGMLIAVIATLLDRHIIEAGTNGYLMIFAGLIVGGGIGAAMALKVKMTAMPEMVALLNGFGGGASVLIAGAALHDATDPSMQLTIATVASAIIGAVTFWGSLVAIVKLQDIVSDRVSRFPGRQALSAIVGLACIGLGIWIVIRPDALAVYWILVVASSALGVLLIMPIGGADMPVAVALLNSYSGLAAAAAGFVLNNNSLIITGSLVGASGIILSQIMCKAMNRSLANVLSGTVGGETSVGPSADSVYAGKVKSTSAEEVAMFFDSARRVIIVPGYGLAVSQAQHAVRDLARLLEERGIEVEFAIHPVAGRMPGHMNVLLAEADVSYEKLKEMDEINPSFERTDVVLVIGANDVVNPVARTDPKSPIAGMPILDVDKARTVVVIKRSLSPGFAGIPNPLFAADNTLMYFADARKAITDLITAVKEL